MEEQFLSVGVKNNGSRENKVALDQEDTLTLIAHINQKYPRLIHALPGFIKKMGTRSNKKSDNPSEEIGEFTDDELAIMFIWIMYPTSPETSLVQDSSSNSTGEPVNRQIKKVVKNGVRIIVRHMLIASIFKKMEDLDLQDLIDLIDRII